MAKLLEKVFRESLVIELSWEKNIEYQINDTIRNENIDNITFFKIFRKYLSKKFRTLFK